MNASSFITHSHIQQAIPQATTLSLLSGFFKVLLQQRKLIDLKGLSRTTAGTFLDKKDIVQDLSNLFPPCNTCIYNVNVYNNDGFNSCELIANQLSTEMCVCLSLTLPCCASLYHHYVVLYCDGICSALFSLTYSIYLYMYRYIHLYIYMY